jgi:hypothetical protein
LLLGSFEHSKQGSLVAFLEAPKECSPLHGFHLHNPDSLVRLIEHQDQIVLMNLFENRSESKVEYPVQALILDSAKNLTQGLPVDLVNLG